MDKKPCNCKTEVKTNKIIENISQANISKKKYKTSNNIIINFLKFFIPIVLFISVFLLIIPFILYLVFSKRAKRGFIIKLPIQKLLKNV
jgi:hypothetical protein